MKCQNCGADLISGHLYCDVCGTEYQIVPDFEPEIENSMAIALSDIGEMVEEERSADGVSFSPEHKTNASYVQEKKEVRKPPSFSRIFLCVLLISLIICVGYYSYTSSVSYISRQADASLKAQNYQEAAALYEEIRKKEITDADWYVKEAQAKLLSGRESEAENLGKQALELETNKESAYDFMLSFLTERERYQESHDLLMNCEFPAIVEKYGQYAAQIPQVNYESGAYDTSLEIILKNEQPGQFFYTLDGSTPDQASKIYTTPIKLGNGDHVLSAIFCNQYGVCSKVLKKEYHISASVPLAPAVEPVSGTYNTPQMIEIAIEKGTTVHYSTDGSKPDQNSPVYTFPIPMPLGESRYTFVAYSEEGIAGEYTYCDYMLNIKTGLTQEEAESVLIQKLIDTGFLLDRNGALLDRYGVHRYFYQYPVAIGENSYYVFAEHYLENEINDPTGIYYGVDVMQGSVYRLEKEDTHNFMRIDF